MKVEGKYEYSVDPQTVLSLFTSEDYIRERLQHLRSENIKVVHFGESDGRFKTVTQRSVRVKVPGFARKLTNDGQLNLEESFDWELSEGERVKGRMKIDFLKLPGEINGDVEIRRTDSGSEMVMALEGTINLPVIGKKIAHHVAERALKSLNRPDTFTEAYIKAKGL